MARTRKKLATETRSTQVRRHPAPSLRLDQFDRKILTALVEDARARRLETAGVIQRYSAQLNPEAVGIGFIAFVTLVLDYVTAATAERFYQEIRAIPEIVSCYIVSGGYDAILQVATADSYAYSNIVFNRLRRIPGVKDVRSSFVMRVIKENAGLPLTAVPD